MKRLLPASRPSTPRRYLSDSAVGRGRIASMSLPCGALASGGPLSEGPRPISTNSTTPAWPAPGSMSSSGLTAPKVTVTSARTAGPATAPVSASIPEGRLTAIVVALRALAASCASVAYGSRSPPLPPMPSIPSTIRSAYPIACRTSWPTSYFPRPGLSRLPEVDRCRVRGAGRLDPDDLAAGGKRGPRPPPHECAPPPAPAIAAPRRASRSAAYSASPPLSPVPASTTTRARRTRR